MRRYCSTVARQSLFKIIKADIFCDLHSKGGVLSGLQFAVRRQNKTTKYSKFKFIMVSTLTEQIYTVRREYKYSALCLAHSQKKLLALTSYLLKETMDTSTHRIHLQHLYSSFLQSTALIFACSGERSC